MLPEGFYWDFYPSRKGLLIHILDIVAHYCYLINVTAIKNIIFVFDKSKDLGMFAPSFSLKVKVFLIVLHNPESGELVLFH